MKSENKHRIQQDIGQRAYDHREHADPWKALAGNEIVQAHGHKGEKGTCRINGHIRIRIREGSITGAEPVQQMSFDQQKEKSQKGRKQYQQNKTVGQYVFRLFLSAGAHAHGH